ncbi:gamma-tubulin complex component 2-like isoform X2 [Tachypleus tridentatus]|uniref:gamma-tubulin complex component 2-like isoform X2 n=1 Tax=Tachypleus tridentatus TaxID=6853 RepID=UPI003FD29DDD
MSEFKVHHHVSELMKHLGIAQRSSDGVSAESYADLLLKNRTPNVTTKISSMAAMRKLAEKSKDSDGVLEKYENLKAKNVREVDQVVYLLSQINYDEKTKQFLRKNAECKAESQSRRDALAGNFETSDVSLTKEELIELKNRLQREASGGYGSAMKSTKDSTSRKNTGFPVLPSWVKERPFMTWDFVMDSDIEENKVSPIGSLPVPSQEEQLIEDLLFCLGGIEGDLIISKPLVDPYGPRTFVIDESADPSLRELLKRILPICSHYSVVVRFIEEKSQYQYGLVNQALAAAMRQLFKDYFVLIAQLEHQHRQHALSLQKVWFYLQPSLRTMEVLASIANTINKGDCFGGSVLSVLHDRTAALTGDPKAQDLCFYLTQAACVPYFEILEKWIYKGIISDTYSEFLVEDNELVKKEELPVDYSDDYWEKRYTIRRERIPTFLGRIADMILRTGKYLNVIRQCGNDIKFPDAEHIVYTVTERQYVEKIETAYKFASKKLLDLLMEGSDLMGRLRSVKHYFLMDQGDFIVQFLDMAEEELVKDIDDIMPTRLESLLELALRTSVVNSDKYKDDIRVELLPYDLLSQMFKILMITSNDQKDYSELPEMPITGLEAVAFDYEVQWPLSLVINRKVLACYQMLFRHLFYCKHVETLLGSVWTLNKVAKSFSLNASCSYASAFALRQRMLNFVQNLEYYMMFEVVEPSWHVFLTKMHEVTNVDDVLHCHGDFIDSCLKDCMLTHPTLLQTVVRLLKLCVSFSGFMKRSHKHAVEAELSILGDSMLYSVAEETGIQGSSTQMVMGQDSFQQRISSFHYEFNDMLFQLLEMISDQERENYSEKMVNMLYRLDFNNFYSQKMDKKNQQEKTGSTSSSRD